MSGFTRSVLAGNHWYLQAACYVRKYNTGGACRGVLEKCGVCGALRENGDERRILELFLQ